MKVEIAFLSHAKIISIVQMDILALEEDAEIIVPLLDAQQTQSVRVEIVSLYLAKATMTAQLDFSVWEEHAWIDAE